MFESNDPAVLKPMAKTSPRPNVMSDAERLRALSYLDRAIARLRADAADRAADITAAVSTAAMQTRREDR